MRKKVRILRLMILFLFVLMAICGCALLYLSAVNETLTEETQQYLSEVGRQNANAMQKQIEGDFRTVESIAFWIGGMEHLDKAAEMLDRQAKEGSYKRLGVILPDNPTITSDRKAFDLRDRVYYKQAMQGETVLATGLIDRADNQPICVYATPVQKDGENIAVLFATYGEKDLAALLDVPLFGGEGYAFIAAPSGDIVIGTRNRDRMWGGVSNVFTQLNGEGFWQDLDDKKEMRRGMLAGRSGVTEFLCNNELYYLSYTPIGLNQWNVIAVVSADLVAERSAYLSVLSASVCVAVVTLIAALFICLMLMQRKNSRILEQLAFIDPLTGGKNWNGFLREAHRVLEKSGTAPYAMLVFDIDKFKVLNDLFGHEAGNETLRSLWRALKEELNPDEPFARVSSDNFSILLRDGGDAEIEQRVRLLNERMIHCGIAGDYTLVISYGLYHITDKSLEVERMNDRASLARRTVKGKHEQMIAFYDDSVRERILAEKMVENEMEDALRTRQFEMYLQPKYSISTRRIVGAEALVRWNHPSLGLIPPGEFIPLFEKNGFVTRVDSFMLDEVCDKLSNWMARGIAGVPISLNVSRLHLHNQNFVQSVAARAHKSEIPRKMIELELTESTVLDFDVGRLTEIVAELQAEGFLLAMDDFGAGYSSLNLLRRLPVDVLKLDGQFFDFAEDLTRGETVIADIVTMARHLNMAVVAEGVETKQQVDFLATIGCDTVQGYYFAKPMPVADFEALLTENVKEARELQNEC